MNNYHNALKTINYIELIVYIFPWSYGKYFLFFFFCTSNFCIPYLNIFNIDFTVISLLPHGQFGE